MKFLGVLTVVLHFIVGAFGLLGGYAAISTPGGPFGISPDVLKNGPFTDFLIPGLALFVFIGIGHLLTAVIVLRKNKFFPYIQGTMALVTIGWIVIQCWVMEEINGMHISIFIIGTIQGLSALLVLVRNRMFPVDLILGKPEKRGMEQ